jgi:two-component system, NtrC family, sensor kinase
MAPDVLDTQPMVSFAERDRVFEAVRRAKKELEGTIDAILDPVLLIDSFFRIQRANLAVSDAGVCNIQDIIGSRCHQILFDRSKPCEGCPVEDCTDTGDVGFIGHVELKHEALQQTLRMHAYRFRAYKGEQPFYVCSYRDVTEERSLQRQVVQSEKLAAVGQLAGGAAHELNNPLGVIRSFAQMGLTRAGFLQDEELIDDFEEILKATERCTRIVRGLLDFSRTPKDEVGAVDLAQVLSDALFLVKTQFKKKTVQVIEDFNAGIPRAHGNTNKLQQVAVNLIQNAFQAVPAGGRIRIATRTAGDGFVDMVVADDGPGISDDVRNKLFDPFFTTKSTGVGTGLGLSITYGIVQEHGGTISLEEGGTNSGATFVVRLPVKGVEKC